MNCTVKVMAQYHENYSETDIPYWKPKGGQEFQIVIDSDVLMYSNDLIKHLMEIVSAQSDEMHGIKVSWLHGMLKKEHYDETQKAMLNKMVFKYNTYLKNKK